MTQIFLSYRREDTAGHAGRLYDQLAAQYGDDQVFMDLDKITPGADFGDVIERAIKSSQAVIVLIGQRWLSLTDQQSRRRIDLDDDFVRREVAMALESGTPVIPVLTQNATMPRAEDLPADLQELARYQAIDISDSRWNFDVARLIHVLVRDFELSPAPTEAGGGWSAESGSAQQTALQHHVALIALATNQIGEQAAWLKERIARLATRLTSDEEVKHVVRARRSLGALEDYGLLAVTNRRVAYVGRHLWGQPILQEIPLQVIESAEYKSQLIRKVLRIEAGPVSQTFAEIVPEPRTAEIVEYIRSRVKAKS